MMAWRWLLSFPTDERMELDERMKRGEEILDGVTPTFLYERLGSTRSSQPYRAGAVWLGCRIAARMTGPGSH
jgi:hypothetical protein